MAMREKWEGMMMKMIVGTSDRIANDFYMLAISF